MEDTVSAPRVTALVVSHNCVSDLRRCLTALETTVPRNLLEIVVVDNGSRDGSGALDTEFPHAHFLRLPKNFGSTRALNIGIRTAKGEYTFFLPPQATVQPDTLSRLCEILESRPDLGAVCPRIESAYPLPDAAALSAMWRSGQFPGAVPVASDAETEVEFPKAAPILVRKAFVASMNFFDERFGDFGPYLELCYQIRSAGKRILVVPSVIAPGGESPVPSDETQYVADRALGSAAYVGKHFGAGAAISFRLKAIASALGSFNFGLLSALVTGAKIDGNQSGA